MFLKRLELQGFKTFASRTELEFSGGVTAIVGPNGSGKSNVADAVRWVLGEQSLRQLRCKKTEDVVFAGGAGRPPAGMAEVSITFDNATAWLDSAFQEVVVTRRAHRSGENEYFLNRERVRLRDITDLLMKANVSPNGYTVIGQGMVDLALSLKPEERRELFEDAAGIRHHYVRLNEARNRLAATDANLQRVRDVIGEVEPRLKQLERRARQLRERDGVRAELRAHLAGWYGHRWVELTGEVDEAAAREREAADALAQAREMADANADQVAEIGQRQQALRVRLAEIERARLELSARGERIERELALRHERAAAARARADELRAEVAELTERARLDEDAIDRARSEIARLEREVAALSKELSTVDGAGDARRAHWTALRQQLLEAEAVQARLRQERSALEADLARIEPRRAELTAEAARQEEAAAHDQARIAAVTAELDQHESARAAAEAGAADLASQSGRLREQIAACRQAQEAIGTHLAELTRNRAALQGRIDILTDAREGYAGYYAGVRAVLAAARPAQRGSGVGGQESGRGGTAAHGVRSSAPTLEGVVGLVASLVRVPAELETAVEVALGGHLQDVVVDRWEHAEAAVEMLKRERLGRATFLPLDTVGRGSRTGGDGVPPATGPGVRGIAADLVQADERYRGVVRHLLGRTLIVDDLAVARRVVSGLGGGWQIVTVSGEVVRASGAITGGSDKGADRTLLARERERRELPERLARVADAGQTAEAELAAQRTRQTTLEAEVRRLAVEADAAEQAVAAAREQIGGAAGRLERLRREVEWSVELADRARAELVVLGVREAELSARLAATPAAVDEHERIVGMLRVRLDRLDEVAREHAQRLVHFRSSVATIEGERRAQTRLLEGHEERSARLAAEVEGRRQRIDDLAGSAAALDAEAEELVAARGSIEDQRGALDAEAAPIDADLRHLAEQARLIAAGEAASRSELNELADRVRAVAVVAQSARERRHALAREAALELSDLNAELSVADPPAAYASSSSCDPEERSDEGSVGDGERILRTAQDDRASAQDDKGSAQDDNAPPPELILEPLSSPESTTRRIELLRSRLRAIGAVDPAAVHEYDETLARHAFLSGQAADLVDGSRLLREAIAELETTMQTRFEETFAAVGAAFKRHFTALFGGGTARLVLAEAEGSAVPGVEIIAQPPGKRAQSLSLLSGGERSLTAVAILFAILEVNPTPVCLLDEVDAALDDANIVRFAQTLRQFGTRTQFVVVTHNRGTMEAADALYGVSMMDRATSRTVSLKLADIAAA